MNQRTPFDEAPATVEEIRAARRLAEATETGGTDGADLEALAVVRLLEAVSEPRAADEIAARRLRNELTARASRRLRAHAARWIAATAAAVAGVALLSVFSLRSPARPSASVLVAREAEARAAVVAVVGTLGAEYGPSRRIAAVSEQQWRLRLVTRFDSERFEQLADESSESSAAEGGQAPPGATRGVPTPGGSS